MARTGKAMIYLVVLVAVLTEEVWLPRVAAKHASTETKYTATTMDQGEEFVEGEEEDEAESSLPNIMLVLVDDQGYGDIGYNDKIMHTPHLDKLSSVEGAVRFNNFYSAATCTPARAMLMTGRYATRIGMQDSVIHATEPRGVPLTEVFLGQKLQEQGYTTSMIGKWHLGMHQQQYLPQERGFNNFYGIYTGGGSHTRHISVSQPFTARMQDVEPMIFQGANIWDNGEVSSDNYDTVHSTELYTKRAIQELSNFQNSDSPFFLYLSYQAVHDPLEVGDEKFITETKCNKIDSENTRQVLCGMMAEIDDGVGQIHEYLQDALMWKNMVFFYASDNGGVTEHGSSNAPFHGEKGMYWEGGVHVPAFVAGGYLKSSLRSTIRLEDRTLDSLVHITDLHTTILHLANYDWQADDYTLDGKTFWAQLTSKSKSATKREEILINANSELFAESGAIIVGDYKLLKNPDPKESHIYSEVRKNLANVEVEGVQSREELVSIISATSFDILKGSYHLYNIKLNPSEASSEDCESPEECSNLAENEEFSELFEEMKAKLERYRENSEESTFSWEDDGLLANPVVFNFVWSPWRDEGGHPYASYLGLHQRSTTASISERKSDLSDAASSSPETVSMLSAKSFLSLTSDSMLIAFACVMGIALVVATVSFFIRRQFRKVGFVSQGDGVRYTPL